MGYSKFKYEDLKNLCSTAFQKFGCSEKDSETITDVLLLSDLFGIESHGVQRLVRYHKGISSGMMNVKAEMKIVQETSVSAVVEMNRCRWVGRLMDLEKILLMQRKFYITFRTNWEEE